MDCHSLRWRNIEKNRLWTIDRTQLCFGYLMLKAYFDSQVDISCSKLDTGVWSSGNRSWLEEQRLRVINNRWNMKPGARERRLK